MSKSKGNRIVRERAVPFYENMGFLVDKVEKTGRYQLTKDLYANDVLGEDYTDQGFDLVCLHTDAVVFVQVKTNSPPTQKWYRDFASMYAGASVYVHCYTWYDADGCRLQDYRSNGHLINTDLRKSKNDDARRVIWFDTDEIKKQLLPDIFV